MVLLWENLQVVVNACITWLIIKTDQAVLSGYMDLWEWFTKYFYETMITMNDCKCVGSWTCSMDHHLIFAVE